MITRRGVLAGTGGLVAITAAGAAAGQPANAATRGGMEDMQITRVGSQPSSKGSAEYFTGSVRVDPLVRPGDVICFPPGLRHWHGATPTTALTHIAIQETLNGKAVNWMEKVSDEQFRK